MSCSVLGRRCRDLLVQLYLQWPELRVPVPEVLPHSGGATSGSTCKVSGEARGGPDEGLLWATSILYCWCRDLSRVVEKCASSGSRRTTTCRQCWRFWAAVLALVGA